MPDQELQDNLTGWLAGLAVERRVYVPVSRDGNRAFAEIEGTVNISLGLPQGSTILPVKKLFLPPQETLLEFDAGRLSAPAPPEEPSVIFGMHVCELSADRLLTGIMAGGVPDAPYLQRRRQALTIGVTCRRAEYCFCERTGHDRAGPGDFDLFLDFGGDGLATGRPRLIVGSAAGAELASDAPFPVEDVLGVTASTSADTGLFQEGGRGFISAPRPVDSPLSSGGAGDMARWPLDNLPEIVRDAFDNAMWEELSYRCLGCGNCTAVCPLCYCFYTRDETGLDPDRGRRLRLWDSCQLVAFARVAGGHNFREARSERIWYRFSHKFMRIQEGFGKPGCSGCGACFNYCPAAIDPRRVIGSLLEASHV